MTGLPPDELFGTTDEIPSERVMEVLKRLVPKEPLEQQWKEVQQ